MAILPELKSVVRLYDRRSGTERFVQAVEVHGQVAFLSFKHPQTGAIDRQPFSTAEIEERFEVLSADTAAFRGNAEVVSLVAEAYRLQHAYLFNSLFATETSLIDLLPHQLAAVYGVPPTPACPDGELGMVDMPRLRFLLADDAGAGKTIMAGLLIRELLLRRLVRRVLVVPPAGLVGNWERELRILASSDIDPERNPFTDPANDLVIISVDTLWRERVQAAFLAASPYDLVIFDEAHKLSAQRNADLTIERTHRYRLAEQVARQNRHLLLLTATPHMGKDDPYYLLWRLLEPELFSTPEAFQRLEPAQKQRYLLRRMKEEMVRFDGSPIFPPRSSSTIQYPLQQGSGHEQDLYDQVTHYCETHFDRAKQRNRSAAGLAMSILQRRLASSTWALWKSLERRQQKLYQQLQDLESGLLSQTQFETRQSSLPDRDVRDFKTGDEEEAQDGQEEAERQDETLEGATDARTLAELDAEWREVCHLAALARQVYDRQHESKFERLWKLLEEYPATKALIFTEFRDTLDFLVSRLEGRGLTGNIAQIHGGMDYQERDRQAAAFQDPAGARIMAATDAAGEGINLQQSCWVLVNYDIPWNPARLEQRMGRVHRYKQRHPVSLLNMVSQNTREGRVLKVLLDKLETIRRELGSDKVFDVIGQQFAGKPLTELIFEAVIEGKEEQTRRELEQLDAQHFKELLAAQARRVQISQVRALLDGLRRQQEQAELRRMMPAYVRRFFQLAAPLVGAGICGDVEGLFWLVTCPAHLQPALDGYPPELRQRLTFERQLAMPELSRAPQAIYLHPGEPVFEALSNLFLGQYEAEATRGATFYDLETDQPYLFYLARAQVLRDPDALSHTPGAAEPASGEEAEIVEEKMTGVRRYPDGGCQLAPAHLLLTLFPQHSAEAAGAAPGAPGAEAALRALAGDTAPVEAYLVHTLTQPALQAHRQAEEERLPELQGQLRTAYNLRQAELFKQRRLLKEAVEREVPAASSKLRQCETELAGLDRRRRQAEAALYARVDRLRLGSVSLYAQALVLPLPAAAAEIERLARAEAVALAEVIRREQAAGSTVEDVSNPQLKAGFDLKMVRADGSQRYVEVKGRCGRQAVELTENEWAQSANHRDRYWLYVVYDCEAVPVLYRVPDPFGRLLARQTGSVRINSADVIQASMSDSC